MTEIRCQCKNTELCNILRADKLFSEQLQESQDPIFFCLNNPFVLQLRLGMQVTLWQARLEIFIIPFG